MPFTLAQIEGVANSTLDFYMRKGGWRDQHIQARPLLSKMRAKQKTIPGGKGLVSLPVNMQVESVLQGFQYDDTVTYGSPNNIKRVTAPWRLFHVGINITMHELLHDGISVVDDVGDKTVEHTDRELTMLVNILEYKIKDMQEGFERGLNALFWQDGTQSALAFPGVQGWVSPTPTVGVVGGIDAALNVKWQNRASTAISLGASAATQAVLRTLDFEIPQLRRFGGNPNIGVAGSSMIDRLKAEYRANGTFTMTGYAQKKDLSVGDIQVGNIDIFYDPTLDDLNQAKYLYVLDIARLTPFVIEGEDEKEHTPPRPEDKYVFYKAKTWVGGMIADQRNCHGVYAFP